MAAFGLPGSDERPVDVPGSEWRDVLACISGERLTGLAVAAARTGWLRLQDDQAKDLLERHRQAMLWALTIERRVTRLSANLEQGGLPVVVLKGPALAHRAYPDPSWRSFGDLDLLVRTADWRRACAVLQGSGLRRARPEPRAGFDERFGKAAVFTADDGLQVDLHRTLVLGPVGLWLDPAELIDRGTWLRLGGVPVRRLDDTAMLLNACLHASLGARPPLMVPLRDIAQLWALAEVDWDTLEDWSRRWRVGAIVGHAFATVRDVLRVDIPEAGRSLASRPWDRADRRVLKSYTTSRRDRGGLALSTLRAISGAREKLAYVLALLVPERDFLSARSGRRPSYLRRWMVPLRWLRGRRLPDAALERSVVPFPEKEGTV